MIRIFLLLALLLPASASAQFAVGPGPMPPLPGARGLNFINAGPLTTAQRGPRPTDDVNAGIYPGSTWRANINGQWTTWQNLAAGVGNATWQQFTNIPLPGDVVGLYVSAAAANAGGTGHTTGDIITIQGGAKFVITAAAGVITAVQALTTAGTVQNMYGVCSPTTVASPQLATSGSGINATFNVTIAYPVLYGMRQLTKCYTSNLVQVQHSVTSDTLNVGYLSDGAVDASTIAAFAASTTPMETATLFTTVSRPGVRTWYDQGGTAMNATQTTIANQPVVFGGRMCGNVPCVMFNSQGGAFASGPYPSATSMTIPAFTIDGQNAVYSFMGGAITATAAGIGYLNQVGNPNFFGINTNTLATCLNANGASADNVALGTMLPETPSVSQCGFKGGWALPDSAVFPAQQTVPASTGYFPRMASGTAAAGSTVALTASGGILSASRTVTYTVTAADAATSDPNGAALIGLITAINADATMAYAGVTAAVSPVNSAWMHVSVPVGFVYTFSVAGTGAVTMTSTTVPNITQTSGTFSGGFLGKNTDGTNTGNSFHGFHAFIPWAMTAAQLSAMRRSIEHHYGLVPQPGAVVVLVGASQFSGYLTPWLQNMSVELARTLGRADLQIFNPAVSGQKISSIDSTFWATTYLPILQRVKSPFAANNWAIIVPTYNDLATPGTPATMLASMQSLAVKAKAAGYKAFCSTEVLSNAGNYWNGGTLNAQLVLFQGLLLASPGSCDVVVDLTAKGMFGSVAGPWSLPWFEQYDAGTHRGPAGAALVAEIYAAALRNYLQ